MIFMLWPEGKIVKNKIDLKLFWILAVSSW